MGAGAMGAVEENVAGLRGIRRILKPSRRSNRRQFGVRARKKSCGICLQTNTLQKRQRPIADIQHLWAREDRMSGLTQRRQFNPTALSGTHAKDHDARITGGDAITRALGQSAMPSQPRRESSLR